MPIYQIKSFLRHEAAGGICLMFAAVLAMICANSDLSVWYQKLLNFHFQIGFQDPMGNPFDLFTVKKPIIYWINDGLMALFFFLVGLEIKREVFVGELSSVSRVVLPGLAAVGGIVAPVLIFYYFNRGIPETIHGWAIPAATDIAFALGILALLGKRVPMQIKIFLTAVAIIDDLAAIIIIALFYTSKLSVASLAVAAVGILALAVLNRMRVKKVSPYILIGVLIWVCVLKSGIHATLAGVIIALSIPLKDEQGTMENSPLERLEHDLHPWVAFLVLPIFGFANAGVSFAGMSLDYLTNPLTLGIITGLFLGKQLGIFSMIVAAVKLGIAKKPAGTSWVQIYAMSVLCGVGFTMSLFIGELAFADQTLASSVRIGVLGGSILSAILGSAIFYLFCPNGKKEQL